MPKKQIYEISDFSGGLNAYADPRDISDSEFSQNWNAVVDKNGILRVIGSAVEHINARQMSNANMQSGSGLFMFSSDYIWSSQGVDTSFGFGYESGTVASVEGDGTGAVFNTEIELEATSTLVGTDDSLDDYYKGMSILIHNGTGAGQSRRISAYDASSRKIQVTEAFDTGLSTDSEYRIYRWMSHGFDTNRTDANADTTHVEDFITDGTSTYFETSALSSLSSAGFSSASNFFAVTKQASITQAAMEDLGYIQCIDGAESKLTLKAGVNYTISFLAAFKNKWHFDYSNGDTDGSSLGIGASVPSIELYSDTVTNGTANQEYQNTGLYLQSDGHWLQKGLQSDYAHATKSYANYIINGGFRNAIDIDTTNSFDATKWNVVDNNDSISSDSLDWAISSDAPWYNNVEENQSLDMRRTHLTGQSSNETSFSFNDDGTPRRWIECTTTLDVATKYHLNFVYSLGPVVYSIYDATDSKDIISWTSNGTNHSTGQTQFQGAIMRNTHYTMLPFQSNPIDESTENVQWTGTNYISFFVPQDEGGSATTKDIRIRFAGAEGGMQDFNPDVGAGNTFATQESIDYNYNIQTNGIASFHARQITGVTLYKARNDLVTMSYRNNSNSPLIGSPNLWSKYSTSFKIPADYNDASDWILRIRGGTYVGANSSGYYFTQAPTNDNDTGIAGTSLQDQEVYISDIKLTASDSYPDEENITLLTDSDSMHTNMHLYSNKQAGNWTQNWIQWSNPKGRPNFNYGNGVLRISDSNFNNENPNILMYYDDNTTSYHPDFEERGWKTKEGFLTSNPTFVTSVATTNFSPIFSNPNQIFNAIDFQNTYFQGATYTSRGQGAEGAIDTNWRYDCWGPESNLTASGMGLITRYMYDTDSTIEFMNNETHGSNAYLASFDSFGLSSNSDKVHPTNCGLGTITVHSAGHTDSGGHTSTDKTEAIWPLKALIKMRDLRDFVQQEQMNATHVAGIDFEIEYEFQGCLRNNNGGDGGPGVFSGSTHTPWFKVQAGRWMNEVPIESNITKEYFINNSSIYSDSSILSIIDNLDYIDFGKSQWDEGVLWAWIFNGANNFTTNDNSGSMELLTPDQEIVYDANGNWSDRIRFRIKLEGTLNFNNGNISIEEDRDIIVSIFDYLDDAPFQSNQVWGTKGHLERDIGTWNTGNPSVLDKTAYFTSRQYSNWTRFFVNKLDVFFHDNGYSQLDTEVDGFDSSHTIENGQNVEAVLVFGTTEEGVTASGWEERDFQIALTTVDIFETEGNLTLSSTVTGTISSTLAPDLRLHMGREYYDNPLIKKTKIYMKSNDSNTWYLQWYVNHKGTDAGKLYSSSSGSFATNDSAIESIRTFYMNRTKNKNFNEINSYESESMIPQEDALSKDTLTCRYKTSVIANNRLYVGNIKSSEGRVYGDRMIKSPINKYNVLPASNFIDVAINDGDEILGLEYYKDKILQFKRKKVFVIDISGDYENLVDTFDNVGVKGQYSVTKTSHGIAWANKSGCYLYDGESLENLIDGKMPTSSSYENPGITNNRWCANNDTGDCVIGYDKNKDTLLINFSKDNKAIVNSPSGATYHFKTKSWTLLTTVWSDNTAATQSGDMTNMITGNDGDILFYHINSGGAYGINTLRKWNHEANDNLATKVFTFTTKDITFGSINVRKKVYGIYVTYRVRESEDTRTNIDSGVNVVAAVDGSSNFSVAFSSSSKFAFGQSNSSGTSCYSDASGTLTLNETDGIWKTAHLKPSTPSQLNNISSIMIKFLGTAVPYDFEINDISIIYKTKGLK